MLTDEQLEIISAAIQPLFQYLEQEVITDVARRIKKTLTYTRTAELQAMSMLKLGYSPARIRKEAMKILKADPEYRKLVAKNTLEYKKEVRKKISEITREAYRAGNEIISTAGNMSWIDDLRVWKKNGIDLDDDSFLSQLTGTFTAQTAGELRNLTRSTGFKMVSGFASVENAYQNILDKAVINICSGIFSQEKVLKDSIHDLASSGLRTIDFTSGYSMQLDTAARLAIRTGCHQLSGKMLDKNVLNSGQNLIYVSKHWGARNTGEGHANHEAWQGKVYYIKSGEDYSEEAKRIGQDRIMDLWYATGYSVDGKHENDPLGLYGYNCRHLHFVWFLGASSLPKENPEPGPFIINGKEYDYYKMTQKLRSMERAVRALKREKEALKALDIDTTEIDAKIRTRTREYKGFCSACNLPTNTTKLRYECGTSDLKKTKAWREYAEVKNSIDKKIDIGSIKGIRFEKTSHKTQLSEDDITTIKQTIADLSEEYEIKLDALEIGEYTDIDHRNAPLFYRMDDSTGEFIGKLVINNTCEFWSNLRIRQQVLLNSSFAGDSLNDFVIHEMAHAITYKGCRTFAEAEELAKELKPLYVNGVSRYSWQTKDGSEVIAEAFVKVRIGERIPEEAQRLLDQYIEVWKK